MEDIYNQNEIEKFADEFAKKTTDKLKDNLLDDFYKDVSVYLDEHYSNFKERVESDLIKSICEEYVKSPEKYKFANLRKKMFLENKEELTKALTDEAIYKNVEDIIRNYTRKEYNFEWQWKEGIARFILENFNKLKDDKRINEWIGRDIERKNKRINWLEEKLREVSNILED